MQAPQNALGTSRLKSNGQSPFEMAGDQWQSIQDYASSVAGIDAPAITLISDTVYGIIALQKDCQKWQSSTFPAVVALARMTYDYASAVVPPAYTALEKALEALDQGTGSKADVIAILQPLKVKSADLQSAATKLLPDIQTFVSDSKIVAQQVANAGGSEGVISAIIAKLVESGSSPASYMEAINQVTIAVSQSAFALHEAGDPAVLVAVDKMAGGWGAISSDLGDLQNWIDSQIDLDQPFVSELAVDAALAEWADLANEVQAFINNCAG